MNLQEQFFKDQMQIIHESRNAKEEDFERMQQEERAKAKESSKNSVNAEELRRRYGVSEYKFMNYLCTSNCGILFIQLNIGKSSAEFLFGLYLENFL